MNIISNKILSGYRNKVEYFFFAFDDDSLSLASRKKGSRIGLIPFKGSELAHPQINKAAQAILRILNENKIKKRDLKGLLLRYSFSTQKIFAVLFVKDENFNFEIFKLKKTIANYFAVYYSEPKSPAFVFTKKLYEFGKSEITEKVDELSFSYPIDGFFQVNPIMFSKFMKLLKRFLNRFKNDFKDIYLFDLYSGVGVIGISIATFFKAVISVESTKGSKKFALKNASKNLVQNFAFIEGKVEDVIGNLPLNSQAVFVDPPRSGLLKRVIEELLNKKPNWIFYLSCNPEKQKKDLESFKLLYNEIYNCDFDFFPNTDHFERFIVLKKIKKDKRI